MKIYSKKDTDLDTLILGCTHYLLLIKVIGKYIPEHIRILEQGKIVSEKLLEYLEKHEEIDSRISRNGTITFQTTEYAESFESKAALFLGWKVQAETVQL